MKTTRFLLENLAARVVGTKIPPYWLGRPVELAEVDAATFTGIKQLSDDELADWVRSNALGVPMQMPMTLRIEGGEELLLPYEPIVSLTGRNIIVKRQVNKSKTRGSIKERWAQDDYGIRIEGVLIGQDGYPVGEVAKLRKFCEAAQVEVYSPLLDIFGITRMVVESYEFPATTGMHNQNYSLECVSDETYKLLFRDPTANHTTGKKGEKK